MTPKFARSANVEATTASSTVDRLALKPLIFSMFTRTKSRGYVKHNGLLIVYALQTVYGEKQTELAQKHLWKKSLVIQ